MDFSFFSIIRRSIGPDVLLDYLLNIWPVPGAMPMHRCAAKKNGGCHRNMARKKIEICETAHQQSPASVQQLAKEREGGGRNILLHFPFARIWLICKLFRDLEMLRRTVRIMPTCCVLCWRRDIDASRCETQNEKLFSSFSLTLARHTFTPAHQFVDLWTMHSIRSVFMKEGVGN